MWHDRKLVGAAALSLLLTFIAIGWPLSALRDQSGPFVIRYDTLSGLAVAGGWESLSFMFITGLAIVAGGWFLASTLYRSARFLSYLLIAGALASSVFFLAFSIMLVRLN